MTQRAEGLVRRKVLLSLGSSIQDSMKTSEYAGVPFEQARSHPWTDASGHARFKYYDLTAAPEHIRHSLEDFLPWAQYAAVEDFYRMLEAINRPDSVFETNDCELSGPAKNEHPAIPKAFGCSGRVMLLFRKLEQNTRPGSIEQLKTRLHLALIELDQSFEWGVIGTTLVPARYLALADHGDNQLGQQLMISFWVWGDTEADTMVNLQRLFKNLSRALHKLSK